MVAVSLKKKTKFTNPLNYIPGFEELGVAPFYKGMPASAKVVFFFKQKTAYEVVASDWSSDVCSSDLVKLHSFNSAYHQ